VTKDGRTVTRAADRDPLSRQRALALNAELGPSTVGAAPTILPPRATAGGTLRRLQEEALRQFAARGYHAVSVRDLAGAVGIHPSTVYAHVESKHDLLAELIRIGHDEQGDRLQAAYAEAEEDPVEQLAALCAAHVRVHADYPMLMRVAHRELESLTPDARAAAYAMRVRLERLALDILARVREHGACKDFEPLLVLTALGSMGLRVAEWWRPELGIGVDELADTYAEFARRLIR
jgi:AcrR family transcriptional regulator